MTYLTLLELKDNGVIINYHSDTEVYIEEWVDVFALRAMLRSADVLFDQRIDTNR